MIPWCLYPLSRTVSGKDESSKVKIAVLSEGGVEDKEKRASRTPMGLLPKHGLIAGRLLVPITRAGDRDLMILQLQASTSMRTSKKSAALITMLRILEDGRLGIRAAIALDCQAGAGAMARARASSIHRPMLLSLDRAGVCLRRDRDRDRNRNRICKTCMAPGARIRPPVLVPDPERSAYHMRATRCVWLSRLRNMAACSMLLRSNIP